MTQLGQHAPIHEIVLFQIDQDRFNFKTLAIFSNQFMFFVGFFWRAGVCAGQRIGKCINTWVQIRSHLMKLLSDDLSSAD